MKEHKFLYYALSILVIIFLFFLFLLARLDIKKNQSENITLINNPISSYLMNPNLYQGFYFGDTNLSNYCFMSNNAQIFVIIVNGTEVYRK